MESQAALMIRRFREGTPQSRQARRGNEVKEELWYIDKRGHSVLDESTVDLPRSASPIKPTKQSLPYNHLASDTNSFQQKKNTIDDLISSDIFHIENFDTNDTGIRASHERNYVGRTTRSSFERNNMMDMSLERPRFRFQDSPLRNSFQHDRFMSSVETLGQLGGFKGLSTAELKLDGIRGDKQETEKDMKMVESELLELIKKLGGGGEQTKLTEYGVPESIPQVCNKIHGDMVDFVSKYQIKHKEEDDEEKQRKERDERMKEAGRQEEKAKSVMEYNYFDLGDRKNPYLDRDDWLDATFFRDNNVNIVASRDMDEIEDGTLEKVNSDPLHITNVSEMNKLYGPSATKERFIPPSTMSTFDGSRARVIDISSHDRKIIQRDRLNIFYQQRTGSEGRSVLFPRHVNSEENGYDTLQPSSNGGATKASTIHYHHKFVNGAAKEITVKLNSTMHTLALALPAPVEPKEDKLEEKLDKVIDTLKRGVEVREENMKSPVSLAAKTTEDEGQSKAVDAVEKKEVSTAPVVKSIKAQLADMDGVLGAEDDDEKVASKASPKVSGKMFRDPVAGVDHDLLGYSPYLRHTVNSQVPYSSPAAVKILPAPSAPPMPPVALPRVPLSGTKGTSSTREPPMDRHHEVNHQYAQTHRSYAHHHAAEQYENIPLNIPSRQLHEKFHHISTIKPPKKIDTSANMVEKQDYLLKMRALRTQMF